MKNLNNSLFKKFESNKINNLAKVIGGAQMKTTYNNGNSCDLFITADDNKCASSDGYLYNSSTGDKIYGDLYATDCN